MPRLPDRPDLDHLKRQAKDLLALYKRSDRSAVARIRNALPAAGSQSDAAIASFGLRLHDAQSCIAREYGFKSWTDLKQFVDIRTAANSDQASFVLAWLRLVYAADIVGGANRARPELAARLLEAPPGLPATDPYLACAIGDEATLRTTIANDPTWLNRKGGRLGLTPLIAVTHSSLLRLPEFRERLHACARLLLDSGADPNLTVGNRWGQPTDDKPSEAHHVSALYGAAGQNRDPELTQLLLDHGADPNDGESLYHGLESPECTRILLQAGARVTGSNALYRALDLEAVDVLNLLLSHGADPNEKPTSRPTSDWGSPLLWAIRRRRSPAHIAALVEAGADPLASTPDGVSAHTLALRFGMPDVAAVLSRSGSEYQRAPAEEFMAACARGDEHAARSIQQQHPELPAALLEAQLRMLPELAAQGCSAAVGVMVRLGWPITTRGGDWDASAINHAVFRGDAAMTRFLLDHGAQWTEPHGHGDNACGTLGWASINKPVEGGDWIGCAEALVDHGMPRAEPDPQDARSVLVDGRRKWFSDEVREFLLGQEAP